MPTGTPFIRRLQEISAGEDAFYLEPGRITVEFREPRQALEKLLALAMAISNDFDRFERTTRIT